MADDFAQLSESKGEPDLRNNVNQNCNLNGVNAQIQELSNTMAYLHQKQNGQFSTMLQEIQSLNTNMMNILQLLVEQKKSIDTVTTIPFLQHTAQASELKDVYVTPVPEMNHVGELSEAPEDDAPEDMPEDDAPEDEAPEDMPEDDEIPDIEEEEAPDVEVPESPQEEEGLEVEEWTFKGRSFFKDSENTVYANDAGEIGDAIGQYDPVKNIMKKLPTN
jgi:hypothetical protein